MNEKSKAPPKLKGNLKGRIENLAMSPSYANTLIPVYEAIMNSIHAVQDRFGDDWANRGLIRLTVYQDEDGYPHSFAIEDNGIGLDDANFDSFLTYDSRQKIRKGGKGVGRLTWLKVFHKVGVASVFRDQESLIERRFNFVLDNEQPIQNYRLDPVADDAVQKTVIHLENLKDGYNSNCPKKIETITHSIVAHFLPFLIGEDFPDIIVEGAGEEYSLRAIIRDHTHNPEDHEFKLEGIGEFTIKQLLLSKSLVGKGAEHTVYLSAHERIVTDHGINNQTGLDKSFEYEDVQVLYVGIVSSDYLDGTVTQERNNFDIPKKTLKLITKEAEDKAKEYLIKPIDVVIGLKAETIGRVIANFPRYGYLVKDRREFAKKLPLNSKTDEEIYREMSVHDYRETNNTTTQLSALVMAGVEPESSEEFEKALSDLMERVGEQEQASLAEYIAKRKLIIDLVEARLGYEDKEKKRKYTEQAVHQIICPLRVNSGEIEYGQHNLWLIDDRLAFYGFWASDQNIQKYAVSSDCKDRPDLIVFQGSNLMQREGTDQPIVIIEFKRPARDDYSDDENPLKQVYNYIRKLRDNEISDNAGNLITKVGDDTPFFCYLVCDITPRLLALLEDYSMNQKLPGNRGYFGYNASRKAYVEILQYDELIRDARLRHEAFFAKLGIN